LIARLGLGSVKQYASGDSLTFVLLKSQVPTLILAVALAACTGVTARPTDAPASARPIASARVSVAPAEPDPGLVIVAIGDSIPFNLQDDCPGWSGRW